MFDGADKLCFTEVVYFPVYDHDQMVRRAQAGEIDMNNSFPTGQLEETKKNLPGWPRISPMMATTYVVTNTQEGALQRRPRPQGARHWRWTANTSPSTILQAAARCRPTPSCRHRHERLHARGIRVEIDAARPSA